MGRRLVFGTALLAVAAVATTANAARSRDSSSSITVQVPVPAVQHAEAVSFTLSVKGGTGRPTVHVLNDSAFGNSSAIVAVGVPTKAAATVKYAFVVLVRRFTSARVLSRVAGEIGLRITVSGDHSLKQFDVGQIHGVGCGFYTSFDKAFESSSTANMLYFGTAETFTLQSIRPASVQDSPPEEILDNVLAVVMTSEKCPTPPEGDDPGNK
ncbi:MAG TPA: hypothetical protein VLE97_00480 [Gaiellaceae bacterium]|nr:hypothetical protein [Gaiellaceae bacterium]